MLETKIWKAAMPILPVVNWRERQRSTGKERGVALESAGLREAPHPSLPGWLAWGTSLPLSSSGRREWCPATLWGPLFAA